MEVGLCIGKRIGEADVTCMYIAIDCFKFLGHEIGGCSWAVLSKDW